MAGSRGDLGVFNFAIDRKSHGCEVVEAGADEVAPSGYAVDRVTIRQK